MTTLRLPGELRERLARVAEQTGKTTHDFMLHAIMEKLNEAETRIAMSAEADRRYSNLLASGRGITWPEMRTYLVERAAGKNPPRPKAKG